MRRILFDAIILIAIGIVLFVLPSHIERQGLELFLFKMLLVSAGFVHAHILRKVAFPYIDFKMGHNAGHQYMIIALYVVIIWAYARGG